MYKKVLIILIAALMQSVAFAQSGSSREDVRPEEFQKKLKSTKDAVILDVRTPEEVESGYIKGAENVNYRSPDFKQEVSKLDKNKTYFVYCAAGGRSSKTADLLVEMGFKKVYNLDGGMDAWKEEKLPVEKKKK
jgi:rhodanese-related sulfurtransferase